MLRAIRATARRPGAPLWLRLLVIALVLPLSLAWSLPVFARVLVGPAAHVCHCDRNGPEAECSCPLCNPGQRELVSADIAVRGACGDDSASVGHGLSLAAILPAPFVLVPPFRRAHARGVVLEALPEVFLTPAPRPPRLRVV